MSKPEEFSPLAMYGEKSIFEKRLNEGFTEIAFGRGPWKEVESPGLILDVRIVAIYVFYHPSGKIATFEHPKARDCNLMAHHGEPFEAEYNQLTFHEHKKDYKLNLGEKIDLAEIVQSWE